ncbi:SCP2 sterol-binding domain-containing protein [Mycobacterium sp. ITM-2016-00316]|uniref:SCP2 sterol-binding domain-containing protein n=1 Tax=Mycobacterium sp. ITM-2016-00316 TaxID=2099695 RepID=UPI000CF95214|nr:SCP2 sterol-binding domain-containing protein [Mycobacterium sp. ITM-2016-00316]WNG79823.1 SCP2 sterol-binding domain-containing protein [Mycobacterium sp. ITM-2016-00316]
MSYYSSAEEIYTYLGGVFRAANNTEVGPKLKGADIDLQVYYTDPDASMTVRLREPAIEVFDGADNEEADVKLYMTADIGDKFWRGEYNLGVGLAKGQVKAKGPVNKILKLVPLTKPLFPIYRELVAEKDASA